MYTEFYGLREKPFSLSPDPRFLFLSASHREALAHLLYGIEQGEGFIAITGEVGTGKTTLCRTLLQRLEPGSEIAFLFNPQLSGLELLQAITAEFGLPVEGQSRRELMAQLNDFLLTKKQEGRRVLLLIDEAQNLDSEALEQVRLLSNLETDTQKLIQIVLIGQPELDAMLESPHLRQLRQRISVRWRLSPLSASETRDYVRHRLRVAAGKPVDVFTEMALREVHRRSTGIPRIVNRLCDRALLAGYSDGSREIGLAAVAQAQRELEGGGEEPRSAGIGGERWRFPLGVAAGALVAIAAAAGVWWQQSYGVPFVGSGEHQVAEAPQPARAGRAAPATAPARAGEVPARAAA
ncbi:MAG: AAA family ATPase, partial [Myxococcota bacterium]